MAQAGRTLTLTHALGFSKDGPSAVAFVNDSTLVYSLGSVCVLAPISPHTDTHSSSPTRPAKPQPQTAASPSSQPQQQRFFRGHSEAVTCLAYCPSAHVCASAQQRGSRSKPFILLWDPTDHSIRAKLSSLQGDFHCLAFLKVAEGISRLLTVTDDREHTLSVWQVPSPGRSVRWMGGEGGSASPQPLIQQPAFRDRVEGVVCEPAAAGGGGGGVYVGGGAGGGGGEGSHCVRFVTFGTSHLKFWTLSRHRPALTQRRGAFTPGLAVGETVTCVAYRRNKSGQVVAATSEGRVFFFTDIAATRFVSVRPGVPLRALLPLRSCLLVCTQDASVLSLTDTFPRRETKLQIQEGLTGGRAVEVTGGVILGEQVALLTSCAILTMDARNVSKAKVVQERHWGYVHCGVAHPQLPILYTGGGTPNGGEVKAWHISTDTPQGRSIFLPAPVTCLAISPPWPVTLPDPLTGSPPPLTSPGPSAAAGQQVCLLLAGGSDGAVRVLVWDEHTGRKDVSFERNLTNTPTVLTCGAFSLNGHWMAVGAADGAIHTFALGNTGVLEDGTIDVQRGPVCRGIVGGVRAMQFANVRDADQRKQVVVAVGDDGGVLCFAVPGGHRIADNPQMRGWGFDQWQLPKGPPVAGYWSEPALFRHEGALVDNRASQEAHHDHPLKHTRGVLPHRLFMQGKGPTRQTVLIADTDSRSLFLAPFPHAHPSTSSLPPRPRHSRPSTAPYGLDHEEQHNGAATVTMDQRCTTPHDQLERVTSPHTSPVTAAFFDCSGEVVCTTSHDGAVFLWTTTGTPIKMQPPSPQKGGATLRPSSVPLAALPPPPPEGSKPPPAPPRPSAPPAPPRWKVTTRQNVETWSRPISPVTKGGRRAMTPLASYKMHPGHQSGGPSSRQATPMRQKRSSGTPEREGGRGRGRELATAKRAVAVPQRELDEVAVMTQKRLKEIEAIKQFTVVEPPPPPTETHGEQQPHQPHQPPQQQQQQQEDKQEAKTETDKDKRAAEKDKETPKETIVPTMQQPEAPITIPPMDGKPIILEPPAHTHTATGKKKAIGRSPSERTLPVWYGGANGWTDARPSREVLSKRMEEISRLPPQAMSRRQRLIDEDNQAPIKIGHEDDPVRGGRSKTPPRRVFWDDAKQNHDANRQASRLFRQRSYGDTTRDLFHPNGYSSAPVVLGTAVTDAKASEHPFVVRSGEKDGCYHIDAKLPGGMLTTAISNPRTKCLEVTGQIIKPSTPGVQPRQQQAPSIHATSIPIPAAYDSCHPHIAIHTDPFNGHCVARIPRKIVRTPSPLPDDPVTSNNNNSNDRPGGVGVDTQVEEYTFGHYEPPRGAVIGEN
ncbi:unnamed protein product [Vitrella brassicaformis CCMP3155]|uniref:Uncharacterized protein n=2 Tax=Vitrella brassicaformis TaxID=1169539 RepID=A0A0G4ER20_VITBC|nr:unnamed protein product [Vitrella brassicaformis CCMP3155]|eukprot:CEM00016.1 unnamed protein product [Vitrella brassicaformis CCMP3155]